MVNEVQGGFVQLVEQPQVKAVVKEVDSDYDKVYYSEDETHRVANSSKVSYSQKPVQTYATRTTAPQQYHKVYARDDSNVQWI